MVTVILQFDAVARQYVTRPAVHVLTNRKQGDKPFPDMFGASDSRCSALANTSCPSDACGPLAQCLGGGVDDILVDAAGTQAVRGADLVSPRRPVELSLSSFVGEWINADAHASGLAQVACSVEAGRLVVRAFGAGADGLQDWGEALDVVVFASGVGSDEGSGLSGRYDFPFMVTRLQANLKGGVMVAVTYNTFTDGSGRRAYFMREFLTLAGSR